MLFYILYLGPILKIVVQSVVVGALSFGRAFGQAYQQALHNAKKGGVTPQTLAKQQVM